MPEKTRRAIAFVPHAFECALECAVQPGIFDPVAGLRGGNSHSQRCSTGPTAHGLADEGLPYRRREEHCGLRLAHARIDLFPSPITLCNFGSFSCAQRAVKQGLFNYE